MGRLQIDMLYTFSVSMKYIALAIVVDGDTLMSESNDHFFEFDENILKIKKGEVNQHDYYR